MSTPRVLYLSSWPVGAHGEGAASFVYDQIDALSNDVRAVYVEHRFDNAIGWARRRALGVDVEAIEDLWPERVIALRVWTPRWSSRITRRGVLDDVWRAGPMVAARASRALGGIDLVHAHVVLPAGLLGASISKALGIPLVLQEHSAPFLMHLRSDRDRVAVRQTLEFARSIVAVGEALADRMAEYCNQPEKIQVIPNLIRTDLFVAEKRQVDRGLIRIISIGTLEERKGFLLLLDAIEFLQKKGARFDVRIIGEGPQRPLLSARLSELGFEPGTALPGFLSRRDTAAALQQCDIYVCASQHETFGLAPAEAIAAGRPVVSTRCDGPEAFVDETCGTVISRNDKETLASAILATSQRLAEFSPTSLHDRIEARFGPRTFRTRLMGLYEDVMAGLVAA
jgi:glycosyltransferase involved in cell wall biosynthesis